MFAINGDWIIACVSTLAAIMTRARQYDEGPTRVTGIVYTDAIAQLRLICCLHSSPDIASKKCTNLI